MVSRVSFSSSRSSPPPFPAYTLGVIQSRRDDAPFASLRREARCDPRRSPRAARPRPRTERRRRDAGPPARADDPVQRRARADGRRNQGTAAERDGVAARHLLRDRRSSFVELYSYDNLGKTNYGTAGYLGNGYFITVKHAVVALREDDDRATSRKITSIKVMYRGKEIPAKIVDTGDADVEVHSGDWAIIKTRRSRSAGAAR